MIDITKFDIHGLQSLHISYQNIIENLKEELLELSNSELDGLKNELLEQKINSFEYGMNLIEVRINELNAEKLRFSTEFMFWNYGLRPSSVQVHFLTTSNAYENYGPYVTGQVLFDMENAEELLVKVKEKGHSDGIIRFEETVSTEMPEEVKERLKTEGFYASEISEISH